MHQPDIDAFLERLEVKASNIWDDILKTSKLVNAIDDGSITKELYALYMIETYHYTSHNARNQALAGVRSDSTAVYAKYCFEHAAEEVGHEKMALNDVANAGFSDVKNNVPIIPPPLLETERLVAYLYWISLTGNPLQRLGYSYWAESCYTKISPVLANLQRRLSLQPTQLTFFIAHADIDTEHFEKVRSIIRRTCKSEKDLACIEQAMENTLRMTGTVLDAVYDEYENVKAGRSSRPNFLNCITS